MPDDNHLRPVEGIRPRRRLPIPLLGEKNFDSIIPKIRVHPDLELRWPMDATGLAGRSVSTPHGQHRNTANQDQRNAAWLGNIRHISKSKSDSNLVGFENGVCSTRVEIARLKANG